jgi:hypothetical protein
MGWRTARFSDASISGRLRSARSAARVDAKVLETAKTGEGMLGPRPISQLFAALLVFFADQRAMSSEMVDPAPADLKGRWIGTFDQASHDTQASFSMILTIDEISGREFTGKIDWPDNGNTRTKVQGSVDGNALKWTETEYLSGDDVVLCGLYVGRVEDQSRISGTWMDPKHTIRPKGPDYGTPGGVFSLYRQ